MGKVRYNQRGYVGSSMSERAQLAYETGEKPLTKITKTDLDELNSAIREHFPYLPEIDTVKTLKGLLKGYIGEHSWHHTSKYANKTYFYRVYDVIGDTLQTVGGRDSTGRLEFPYLRDDYDSKEELLAAHIEVTLMPEQQRKACELLARKIAYTKWAPRPGAPLEEVEAANAKCDEFVATQLERFDNQTSTEEVETEEQKKLLHATGGVSYNSDSTQQAQAYAALNTIGHIQQHYGMTQ